MKNLSCNFYTTCNVADTSGTEYVNGVSGIMAYSRCSI